MTDVGSPEGGVVGGDDEQVDAHQQVGERQVLDVEGMHFIGFLYHEATYQNDQVASTSENTHHPHASRTGVNGKMEEICN